MREDFSKAPPPEKRETPPQRRVLVLMADWLAYGLEGAYSDQTEIGVIRKHKTLSGLIRYQPKGEPADWAAAATGILAAERLDVIVVMLGLNDCTSVHEPVAENTDGKSATEKKKINKKADKKDATVKPDGNPSSASNEKPADDELPADVAAEPVVVAPDRSARSPNGVYDFREERC